MKITHIIAIVSIPFLLAACDARPGLEPEIAAQVAAAQIDPDAALAEKVEKAIGVGYGSFAYGVEVTATDGKVELWGTVDNTAARKRFALIAAGVVGVKAVVNHISVDPGA